MGTHEAPLVAILGILLFTLVLGLAIIDHDEALLGEIQIRRDAAFELGFGNKRIEVLSD